MSVATRPAPQTAGTQLQLATFYLSDLCLAVNIGQIQEIVRDVAMTRVPQAPAEVSGVINLRGEVSTVVDLRRVLGLPTASTSQSRRTLIVRSRGESIGLIVDRVADITAVDSHEILPPPPNVGRVDGRYIRGVCPRTNQIVVILDLEQALSQSSETRDSHA